MGATGKKSVICGRAKTALVLHEGGQAKAVLARIVTQRRETAARTRLRFQGPSAFSKGSAKHIRQVVWPAANAILGKLGMNNFGFDLAVSNIGAASINDVAIDVSGYSADLSVCASILSAGTGIPVNENCVITGHIADTAGSVRMVSGIPEKAEAVIRDAESDTLVYPDLDGDLSMGELTPKERDRIEGALNRSKDSIRLSSVRDVEDLVKASFSERDIILASLQEGFFRLPTSALESHTPVARAVHHLAHGLEGRFWTQLHTDLAQGRGQEGVSLVAAYAGYFLRMGKYPPNAGQNLFRVVASLPPETRRLKIRFPLLPVSQCAKLCRFAGDSENEDAWLFLKACSGDLASATTAIIPPSVPETNGTSEMDQALDAVISAIEADTVTSKLTSKIDTARASYVMDTVVITTHEEFCDIIASYFTHLAKHAHGLSGPVDINTAGAEGLEVLERAFSNQGGFQAAEAEARHGTNGGMRHVLDAFTDHYKREQREKHIGRVFKLALDPLDWDRKVRFMKSLIARLKNILPPEITEQPPERFAVHHEPIVRAVVRNRDELLSIFRTF
jgi:hypothetical protein